MTKEQIENLKLGISPIDDRTILIIESGIDWLKKNTTLDCGNIAALPSCARLFLVKFFDVNMLNRTVSSESIEGLSQSYRSESMNDMLWDIADETVGDYLKGRVRFVSAVNRWR